MECVHLLDLLDRETMTRDLKVAIKILKKGERLPVDIYSRLLEDGIDVRLLIKRYER